MSDTTTTEAPEAPAEKASTKQARQPKLSEGERLLAERVADCPHREGCPAPDEKVERYEATGPRGVFQITRCGQCGAQKTVRIRGVDDGSKDEVIER